MGWSAHRGVTRDEAWGDGRAAGCYASSVMRRALLLLVAMHGAGCLSSRYGVRGDELRYLAQQPPEARWQSVRVVQGLGGDTPPPSAAPAVVVDPGLLAIGVGSSGNHGRVQPPPAPRVTGSSGGARGGSWGGGGGRSGAWVVAAVVVAAAAGAFILAGLEGARYDGWVATSPDEPLYLDTPGATTVVPLSQLTPELAAQASGASVYEGSVPRFERLGRAPLDRVGFTLQSSVIAGEIPGSAPGERAWAFGGRALFGGFPIAQLGLGLLVDVASSGPETLLRAGVEAQAMPLLWVGAFAGGGYGVAYLANPTRSEGAPWFHAGAQFELPWTTRLSVQARAGAQWTGVGEGGVWGPAFSLGLSIF